MVECAAAGFSVRLVLAQCAWSLQVALRVSLLAACVESQPRSGSNGVGSGHEGDHKGAARVDRSQP